MWCLTWVRTDVWVIVYVVPHMGTDRCVGYRLLGLLGLLGLAVELTFLLTDCSEPLGGSE